MHTGSKSRTAREADLLHAFALRTALIAALGLVATLAMPSRGTAAVPDSEPRSGYAYGYHTNGGQPGFEYAIIDPREDSMTSSTHRDFRTFKKLMRGLDQDAFWFSLDRKDYIVRDAEWVGRAKKIVQPMQELGEKQGRLGAQQSELGGRQSEIGQEQGQLGRRMGTLGRKIAAIQVSNAANGERTDARAEADARDEMEQLRARMTVLQQKQQPLAQQQRELGRRQADLGRQQRDASGVAEEALEKLAREAIGAGKAESLD